MNTLERNRYTDAWRAIGAALPRPRAILMVSAHWYVAATAVTAMARPRTIHDFYGFPPALFEVQYPAPGLPELADEVAEVAKPDAVGVDRDSWGLDHGTWSVLAHLFPEADVPVLQLSIDASKPMRHHFDLGRRLAALRPEGVLVVGSGNIVHNLPALARGQSGMAFDWARRFDTDVRRRFAEGDAASLVDIERHPDYALAAPTPDHFLPLLYLAGIADATGEPTSVVAEGYEWGALSMTALALGR
jgi:4,5-DOPA dioxygenase extradiol